MIHGLKKLIGRNHASRVSACMQTVNILSVNPLTPVSDRDRVSSYYILTISCRQVMRIKTNINYGITNCSGTKFSRLT